MVFSQTGAEERLWLGSDSQVSPSGKTCQPGSRGTSLLSAPQEQPQLQSQGWPNPKSSHGPSAIPADVSKAQSPPRSFRFSLGSRSTMSQCTSSAGAPGVGVGGHRGHRRARRPGGAARSSHANPCPRRTPWPEPLPAPLPGMSSPVLSPQCQPGMQRSQ